MAEQYAIQGVADCRRIDMPEGCAVQGARRHAVEHSMETGQPVWVLHRAAEGEEWRQVDRVEVLPAAAEREPATPPRAAELPEGSVVAGDKAAWIKSARTPHVPWRGTNGSIATDQLMDNEVLALGAQVLRVGPGGLSRDHGRGVERCPSSGAHPPGVPPVARS